MIDRKIALLFEEGKNNKLLSSDSKAKKYQLNNPD